MLQNYCKPESKNNPRMIGFQVTRKRQKSLENVVKAGQSFDSCNSQPLRKRESCIENIGGRSPVLQILQTIFS